MKPQELIEQVRNGQPVSFTDTMATIEEYYSYQPASFSNGKGHDAILNAAGSNEGSCKIFAFGQLNELSQEETLELFGDYYRIDVLQNPNDSGHANIRTFMKYGWEGIQFENNALNPRG